MKKDVAFFTICNLQYLPKALVLAKSLYETNSETMIIYVFDEEQEGIPLDESYEIRWVKNENIPNFAHIAFMYDVTEACTSVKPYLTIKLLDSYQKVIYLDPDICVYSSLSDLYSLLDSYPILLTPHYTTPIEDATLEYDIGMMRWGSFNLGFYAVNDSEEALRFLNWWSERCIHLCFAETQFGLSTDQKWVSIAPCFFENIKVLFDLGYNMAFWNLHERELSCNEDMSYMVNNKYVLKFFHYSSFDIKNPTAISARPHQWNKVGREDLNTICIDYAKRLKENSVEVSKSKYAYNYMSNGDFISPVLRRAYVSVYKELDPHHDPFDTNGIVARFMRKNNLRVKGDQPYKALSESNLNSSYSWQFKLTNTGLRLLLRIVGPNMFSNFSRLLVFLSSYRKNRKLWKL